MQLTPAVLITIHTAKSIFGHILLPLLCFHIFSNLPKLISYNSSSIDINLSIYAAIDLLPSQGIVLSISVVSSKARIALTLGQEKQKNSSWCWAGPNSDYVEAAIFWNRLHIKQINSIYSLIISKFQWLKTSKIEVFKFIVFNNRVFIRTLIFKREGWRQGDGVIETYSDHLRMDMPGSHFSVSVSTNA